jgi:CheY-like chemotaxis protein
VALVLCTSIDPTVMTTQRLMLERVGHQVICALSEQELEKACSVHRFDVAVIGYSLSAKAKPRVLRLVRKHCAAAAVLELYPQYSDRALADADAWLAMPTAPQEFIDAVNSLAKKSLAE